MGGGCRRGCSLCALVCSLRARSDFASVFSSSLLHLIGIEQQKLLPERTNQETLQFRDRAFQRASSDDPMPAPPQCHHLRADRAREGGDALNWSERIGIARHDKPWRNVGMRSKFNLATRYVESELGGVRHQRLYHVLALEPLGVGDQLEERSAARRVYWAESP